MRYAFADAFELLDSEVVADLSAAFEAFERACDEPAFHAAWIAGGIAADDSSLSARRVRALLARLPAGEPADYCDAFPTWTADAWNNFETALSAAERARVRLRQARRDPIAKGYETVLRELQTIHRRVCAGWHASRLLELGPERLSPAQAWCLRVELRAELAALEGEDA